MPRLSMWRPNHSNDFRFLDRIINEQFTVGGTGINVHLYLGPAIQTNSVDETVPEYSNTSAQNIQDLLFLENRDRSYRPDIYNIRGIYQVANNDFDLSQFGIQLATDTIFVTFHMNNMVQMLGRKLMVGDVLEMEHLKDYFPLDDNNTVPSALRKYYVIKDANRDADGFSQTWWPHLWRVKCEPMVDSQEYKDIISQGPGVSTIYDAFININDAIIAQAERDVPLSGYDTASLYTVPVKAGIGPDVPDSPTADAASFDVPANTTLATVDSQTITPDAAISGYLTGDGLAPNGFPAATGIEFPSNPAIGDYCLRTDYLPNVMFRWDGIAWRRIEASLRTNYTTGAANNQTLKSGFFNNAGVVVTKGGNIVDSRQSLSKALRPPED